MTQFTEKALTESLKKLMNTTPLEKITINNIVTDCKVNRRTFYYHFQDIYAFLEWIFKTEVADLISGNKSHQTWQQGFLNILLYLGQNRKMVINTYHSIGREQLEYHLYNSVYNLVFDVVNEIAVDIKVSENDKAFVANFYKFAFVGLLLDWIRTNMTENPEQIIDKLDKMITGEIHRSLLKFEIQEA